MTTEKINDLTVNIIPGKKNNKIIYLIYPELAMFPSDFLVDLANANGYPAVFIQVPSNEWNNYLTPWPEPPEAKGFQSFGGEASRFKEELISEVIPSVEKNLGLTQLPIRNLVGVSLSGLFALWMWLTDSTFHSIACLSGSFWYAGFMDWFSKLKISKKTGKAYFLLGRDEPKANIAAYRSVGVNTQDVVERLLSAGVPTTFQWVPGNHFSNPEDRLQLGFDAVAND